MSDDYLWDGSGEPDPEVERLENLLSRYRHQPAPLKMPVDKNRSIWSKLYSSHTVAAAAIALLFLLAALSYFMLRQDGHNTVNTARQDEQVTGEGDGKKDESPELPAPPALAPAQPGKLAKDHHPPRERDRQRKRERLSEAVRPDSPDAAREIAREDVRSSHIAGVFDGGDNDRVMTGSVESLEAEAARHFERAQVLLRSFRNAQLTAGDSTLDLSYEKEKSRSLLYKNILLRRGVEARRLYPIEEVLSSLEPILIDIANLPERPSADEVNSIRHRMQKKEIVATLQVYSAQASLAGL